VFLSVIVALAVATLIRLLAYGLSYGLKLRWPPELDTYITGGVPLLCAILLRFFSDVSLHRSSLRRVCGVALSLATFAPASHFYEWGKELGSRVEFTINDPESESGKRRDVTIVNSFTREWLETALLQLPSSVLLGTALWMLLGRWSWLTLLCSCVISPTLFELLYPFGRWGEAAALMAWIGVLAGQIGVWPVAETLHSRKG
jgi:hypothetical protein